MKDLSKLRQSWEDVPLSFPTEKREVAMTQVDRLIYQLKSHNVDSPRAASRLSREQMQAMTGTAVPIGLYNKLMEGVQQKVARAQSSPLAALHMALVVRFGGIVPDADLAATMELLDAHRIHSVLQLGSLPNVIAQLPPAMQGYVLHKTGLRPADNGERDLESDADRLLQDKSLKGVDVGAMRRKDYKKFGIVRCGADVPNVSAFTISVAAPERGGWALSAGSKIKNGLNAKRDAVVLACRVLTEEEVAQRSECSAVLERCIAALKLDREGAKKSVVSKMALSAVNYFEKNVKFNFAKKKERGTNAEPPSETPPCFFLVEKVGGPYVLGSEKNRQHFITNLYDQLLEQLHVPKDTLTYIPATLSCEQVSAILKAAQKQEQQTQQSQSSESMSRGIFGFKPNSWKLTPATWVLVGIVVVLLGVVMIAMAAVVFALSLAVVAVVIPVYILVELFLVPCRCIKRANSGMGSKGKPDEQILPVFPAFGMPDEDVSQSYQSWKSYGSINNPRYDPDFLPPHRDMSHTAPAQDESKRSDLWASFLNDPFCASSATISDALKEAESTAS